MMDINTAPWWGVPAIAGAFLLCGTIVGFVLNRFADRQRERREDDLRIAQHAREDLHRFDDELRELAAELTLVGERMVTSGLKLSVLRTNPTIAREEIEQLRNSTLEDVPRTWALLKAISIIAPDEIREAAENYSQAAQSAADPNNLDPNSAIAADDAATYFTDMVRARLTGLSLSPNRTVDAE